MNPALLDALNVIATAAWAMTGALAAGRFRMDLIGVFVVASVTALGGGSLRDVLLDHYPLYWVANPWILGVTTAAAIVAMIGARYIERVRSVYMVIDAIGLVAVTIIGCDIARQMGHPPAIAVLAGVVTGCGGGIIRDVLCNQVPLLFSSEIYAGASILTGLIYVGGHELALNVEAVALTALTAGLALRLLAVWRKWGLPVFAYTGDWR
jgi:uncharacterized membrane protein YeiH